MAKYLVIVESPPKVKTMINFKGNKRKGRHPGKPAKGSKKGKKDIPGN